MRPTERMAGRINGQWLTAALIPILIGGCSGNVVRDSAPARTHIDFSRIPDAVPRAEPKSRYGNPASYVVLGKRYRVRDSADAFVERGEASWYGTKFHGRRTSSGEVYDMYKMTAAHKTLPLPTYVEVTNLDTGRSVVVKVNDRGPFHDNRIIDLSYAAARKLDITDNGTAPVEIRAIDPSAPSEQPDLQLVDEPKRAFDPDDSPPAVKVAASAADPEKMFSRLAGSETAVFVRPAILAAAEPVEPAPAPVSLDSDPPVETSGIFLQIGAFSSLDNAERLRQRLSASVSDISIQGDAAQAGLFRVRVGPLASEEAADALAARLSELGVRSPRIIRD